MKSTMNSFVRKCGPFLMVLLGIGVMAMAIYKDPSTESCDAVTAERAAREAVMERMAIGADATFEAGRVWQNGDGTYLCQGSVVRSASGTVVKTGYLVSLSCGAGYAIQVLEVDLQ